MDKKRILFLFGGPGAERELSVIAAKGILPAFPAAYDILPIFITPENQWAIADDYCGPAQAWAAAEAMIQHKGVPTDMAIDIMQERNPDLVFIGLYGTFGEDGALQELLDKAELKYTGSDATASALAMHKPRLLQLLQDEAISSPEFLEVPTDTPLEDIQAFCQFVDYPVVVLPASNGSSFGVTVVSSQDDLNAAIDSAREYGETILISKHIPGTEFTCGVLVTEKDQLAALPPTQITLKPAHTFWDYDSKYKPGEECEITPALIDTALTQRIQDLALRVHRLIGADGYSRTDMILGPEDTLYVLEINTLPGMTPMSVVPAQAQAHGLTFTELLEKICLAADSVPAVSES